MPQHQIDHTMAQIQTRSAYLRHCRQRVERDDPRFNDDCPICLNQFNHVQHDDERKEHGVRIQPCGHIFGHLCLSHFFRLHPHEASCPICRCTLYGGFPNLLSMQSLNWRSPYNWEAIHAPAARGQLSHMPTHATGPVTTSTGWIDPVDDALVSGASWNFEMSLEGDFQSLPRLGVASRSDTTSEASQWRWENLLRDEVRLVPVLTGNVRSANHEFPSLI